MPSKSKHGRGKHSHKKKAKFRNIQATAGQTPEASGTMPIATAPSTPAPMAKAPPPKKSSAAMALPMHYQFIAGDLKRIGIITGIVVVLLIIAYFVLS